MKRKIDAYVLSPFTKMLQNWIVDWSTARDFIVKFMFSKKATKFDKIFAVGLTLCSKCKIDGEYFVNFCDLLRKHEL